MINPLAHAPESNAAGVQAILPSQRNGLAGASEQANVGICSGCSEEKTLVSCGICCCLTCRACCAGCNSRGDNKA